MSRTLRFGYCVPAFASPGPKLFRTPSVLEIDAASILGGAKEAERLGFDSIWSCDHLMIGRNHAVVEGWTTLAAIAGATSIPQLGLIHQANLFRPAPVAAKMMATLDFLSGGRFINFFEAGAHRQEHKSYGLDWDEDHAARVARLEEAIGLIRSLYSASEPIDFDGSYYKLDQARLAPKPVRSQIPLWLGGDYPAVTELAARYADGWNTTPVTNAELVRRLGNLDAALAAAGRDRSAIEISLETQILVAPDLVSLRAKVGRMLDVSTQLGDPDPDPALVDFVAGRRDELPDWVTGPWIVGTVDQVVERIAELSAIGVDHLILWFMDAPAFDGMQLFMSEVKPRLT